MFSGADCMRRRMFLKIFNGIFDYIMFRDKSQNEDVAITSIVQGFGAALIERVLRSQPSTAARNILSLSFRDVCIT
jgi:hypothetical protein